MIREKITKYFIDRGFYRVNLGKDFMELFYVTRDNSVSLVWIMEEPGKNGVDEVQFKEYAAKIRGSFASKGFETINLLTLFLSHDPANARKTASGEAFWVADENYGRLVIYDDMPEDFEGLRLPVEEMLSVTGYGRFHDEEQMAVTETAGNVKKKRRTLRTPYRRRPYVTYVLLFINVLTFILTDTFSRFIGTGSWKELGMDNWWLVFHDHEYYRLLTATILHSDISHLLGNMIGLYALGEVLESELGHVRFGVMYILGGLMASTGSCWYYMQQESLELNDLWRALEGADVTSREIARNATYSLGASGAVYALVGILAAFLIANRKNSGVVDVSRLGLFLFYMLYTLIQGIRGDNNIDNAAHVAGFVAGTVLFILIVGIPSYIQEKRKK